MGIGQWEDPAGDTVIAPSLVNHTRLTAHNARTRERSPFIHHTMQPAGISAASYSLPVNEAVHRTTEADEDEREDEDEAEAEDEEAEDDTRSMISRSLLVRSFVNSS